MPQKPSMLMPALYGGIIIGVIAVAPGLKYVNACCCAGVLIGGVLAVFFYKKDFASDMPLLQNSDCMKLGAMAGAFGGVIATILQQLMQVLFEISAKAEIEKQIEELSNKSGAEGAVRMMETIVSMMDSPFFVLGSLVFFVILYSLFGLLGGLIGYSIFKPKQQMMNVQPPTQPPAAV